MLTSSSRAWGLLWNMVDIRATALEKADIPLPVRGGTCAYVPFSGLGLTCLSSCGSYALHHSPRELICTPVTVEPGRPCFLGIICHLLLPCLSNSSPSPEGRALMETSHLSLSTPKFLTIHIEQLWVCVGFHLLRETSLTRVEYIPIYAYVIMS